MTRRRLGTRMLGRSLVDATPDQPYATFIRLSVGLIFATQGIPQFTNPELGVLRFAKIGFANPGSTAHFVGTLDIVCGLLVLLGTLLRVMHPALGDQSRCHFLDEDSRAHTTASGFLVMVTDGRIDFAMFMSLLFLLAAGSGRQLTTAPRAASPLTKQAVTRPTDRTDI